MPLKGFESLCAKNAHQIISKDRKNPQYHKAMGVFATGRMLPVGQEMCIRDSITLQQR